MDTTSHKLDSSDFLAFNDSQPTEFAPQNSSSPQKQWKQTHRNNYQRNWNNQQFSGNYRNNSYNSPDSHRNKSFSGHSNNFRNKRYGNQNNSYDSPNQSYNSSFNNSRSRNDSSYNSSKNVSEGGVNMFNYLHPSFMEDPWAKLERQKLEEDRSCTEPDVLNDSSSCSDEVPVEA